MAKFLEFLQVSPVPLAVLAILIYRLLRFPLEASVRQGVSARTRKANLRLAVVYVFLFLVAVCVVALIQPLVRAHAHHADVDPVTIEQPARTAPRDRVLML